MKRKKLSDFKIKMAASLIFFLAAGYMYFTDNLNQYSALLGVGALLILNAYSMGNRKK